MKTSFSKVVSAVIAALAAEPPVCKAIYRARKSAIPAQDAQAIVVQWEQALPEAGTFRGAPIDWSTRLSVECYARSTDPDDNGDQAVDPLLASVYERLAEQATLGGIINDLNVAGIQVETEADGNRTGWVRIVYTADHRTDNNNLNGS